jgi:lipopolysaccharide export system permease protein
VSPSILNRMIFWELVRVFLLSLGTVTGLFTVVGLVQMASQYGLTLQQLLRILPLSLPSTLPLTIPATTLFATCVVYGRLAHDNEVVALKAAGVHLFGIVRPALLLGLITTGATAALYHTVIPSTQRMLFEQIISDPEEALYNMLRRDRCLRHPNMPYVLYVKDVQGKRLIDVVVKERVKEKDPRTGGDMIVGYGMVARAREAQLRVDPKAGTLSIDSDRFVLYGKKASGTSATSGPFTWDLPDSVNGKDAKVRISALTWDEIPARIATVHAEREVVLQQRAAHQDEVDRITDPNLRAVAQSNVRAYQYQIDTKTRQLRNLQAETHARPALAVSCLVFALIGCPVGIWANRADYLSTFVICFIPTLVIYYPLLLAGQDMGKNGKVPMAVGCWLADGVVGVLALVLTWRLLRR